ncbi:beta-lactamase hydrolase domain-containing protein [[Phormidium] sp. ETS-05]|uniref:beta-lactamase hydrolase domain-containing protein n=1 Tax=[Phormidium] sp. ETS-05 TaxID=222819 RepID=UPI0018EED2C5|nr:sulfur transferase domain-containing protein [[Phormidium] sp. ETS-05]
MFQTVTESLAIGNVVSPAELREIAQKGYRTIVDLCTPAEGNQLNAEEMKQLGFEYISVPVDRQNLKPETLQSFIAAINSASEPVYTRCASGLRAGVMTLLSLADREGWTEQQYLERRQALGIDYNPNSPVEAYAREYFLNSQK